MNRKAFDKATALHEAQVRAARDGTPRIVSVVESFGGGATWYTGTPADSLPGGASPFAVAFGDHIEAAEGKATVAGLAALSQAVAATTDKPIAACLGPSGGLHLVLMPPADGLWHGTLRPLHVEPQLGEVIDGKFHALYS